MATKSPNGRFFPTKVPCRFADKKLTTRFFMQKKNRTFIYKVRLTEDEFELFKEKAAAFGSLSAMVRKAVECLDSQISKHKIDWLEEFSDILHHNNVLLSHISGNLNQGIVGSSPS